MSPLFWGPLALQVRLLATQLGSSSCVSGTTAQGRWGPLVLALGTAALQHLGSPGALGHGQLGSERSLCPLLLGILQREAKYLRVVCC